MGSPLGVSIRSASPDHQLRYPLPPPPPVLVVTGGGGVEVPGVATPTPDPARFARTVLVTGVMNVDGDIFALLASDQAVPGVVRRGDRSQTARVVSISLERQEVILEEGGITLSRRVDEPISIASN